MPELTGSTPDTTLATGDPGDDTARRYRYQSTYAAIMCCMIMDSTFDIMEVFCEHHEDVLLKHTDGTFTGLQVKTRASNQELWKTNDEAVKLSCVRFAKLEANFPDQFRAFRFLTNHPLAATTNGQDIGHVLMTIKAALGVTSLSGPVLRFVNGIAREAGCTDQIAFDALSKAEATDGLPKLEDIEQRLVSTLCSVWHKASECLYDSVVRAARALASECGRASSLAHEDNLPQYVSAIANHDDLERTARINGKRMTQIRVVEVLDYGLSETAPLNGNPATSSKPGVGTIELLHKKLDAGGFSAVSRNSADDLRDKADYLGTVWITKYGSTKGQQRYEHVRSLVLNDAAKSFEATKTNENTFGSQMLAELNNRFRQRRQDGSQLYDCSNEHLEGFAYSLSSECKVQWSQDRPWENDS